MFIFILLNVLIFYLINIFFVYIYIIISNVEFIFVILKQYSLFIFFDLFNYFLDTCYFFKFLYLSLININK